MLNIQIVSRETIRPSSSTPENLRHLQLSLLDQLAPALNVLGTMFYYGNGIDGISLRLKKSLSEVLTCLYPLAGRIREDDTSGYIYVDCNDEGVDFYEVRVDCRLSEFLKQPSTEDLNRIVSYAASKYVPLVIQLSVFNCGGFAVGIATSHKIIDGVSAAIFYKSWAEATRKGGDFLKQVYPKFNFASIFPQRPMQQKLKVVSTVPEMLVAKPFHFEVSRIALLKEKVKAQAGFSPTSVEAVSALIWRCAMRARSEAGLKRRPVAIQAVDIRRRMEPQLPKYSIGNLWIPVFAISEWTIDDCLGCRMGYLEGLLRESGQKVKGDHIREVLKNDGEMVLNESSWNFDPNEWEKCGFDLCNFSSWITFPFNEIDFGWGMPEWSSCGVIPRRNIVFSVPTSNGGIESWVVMVEEEMARFEHDPELLVFVSTKQIISYKEKIPPWKRSCRM